ncbi:ABC transporter ATP-binding protein [Arthrobacter liuii]|uniref:ABC transporter ATP-binding protein n=1 Tax=Arthrobacter liuii TaxID=1476996 RepID=A0ABQ2B0V5_9MICC|nr:ABC transporter ATP-binding protein [Arthrobacter liuii]GGI00572.1 ABC transporter ATP-binding protein [Arthrobacter liuii]
MHHSPSAAPLRLVNVTLEYPDGGGTTTALDRVSLAAEAGQLVSLVGPSGSGKSSLLATAATLVRPSRGQVIIDGTDTAGLTDKDLAALRRGKVGIIFQQPNLLPSLTAVEQLIISDHLRGKPAKAARTKAAELLDVVGLSAGARKLPHQLSGGQRQRVNIARALMGSPKVLLVDEPTAALDHERSASIIALLRQVTTEFGVATVMVTHDTEFVPLTDVVATMRDGVITAPVLTRNGAQ